MFTELIIRNHLDQQFLASALWIDVKNVVTPKTVHQVIADKKGMCVSFWSELVALIRFSKSL